MLDYYRSADGRVFLLQQTLILLGGAAALSAIFGDGRVDLAVARWFYDDALGAFPLTNHWLLKGVLHDAARTASATAELALLGLTAVAWTFQGATRLHAYRQELLFAAAATLAAAAIVGALKHFSDHACPWDLASFGGTATYGPLRSSPAVASSIHGCFPAAHPLSGYAWLAAGLSLYPFAPRLARRWWSLALALGTLFGAVQVARGAHFPSHVLWSAWVAWAVAIAALTACALVSVRVRAARPILPAGAVERLGHTGLPRPQRTQSSH
jgi:membrane-associated PAP2 superfamily phosphatase